MQLGVLFTVLLAVDANCKFQRDEGLAYAKALKQFDLRWFEEPCGWDNDRKDMALLRAMTGWPIVAGQSEITAEDCRDLMIDAAIDVCNLDASWGGGPSVWLRVARMAHDGLARAVAKQHSSFSFRICRSCEVVEMTLADAA